MKKILLMMFILGIFMFLYGCGKVNSKCINYKDDIKSSEKIITAISEGNYKEIKKILKNCTNPNIKDNNGKSALLYAILEGEPKIVELLLLNGANPNEENIFMKPLYIAELEYYNAKNEKIKIIERKNIGGYYNTPNQQADKMIELIEETKEVSKKISNYNKIINLLSKNWDKEVNKETNKQNLIYESDDLLLTYPYNWKYIENYKNRTGVVIISEEIPDTFLGSVVGIVSINIETPNKQQEKISLEDRYLGTEKDRGYILDEKNIKLDNTEAKKVIYYQIEDNTKIKFKTQQITLIKNNKFYTIMYLAPEKIFEHFLQDAESIINSFKIK